MLLFVSIFFSGDRSRYDNTSYLKADGIVVLNGSWDMGSQSLTNVNIDSGTINITALTAATVPIIIKAYANQTAHLQDWTNSADTPLAWITAEGKIQSDKGARLDSTAWIDSLGVWTGGEFTPEHTNGVGNFDFTGGAAESLFTRTAGDAFTSADVGNFINITSGTYKGAKANIVAYIDGDNVVLWGPGWDGDLTGVTYKIYPAPTFMVADEHNISALISTGGNFFLVSDLTTGWCPTSDTKSMFKVKTKASCADIDAMMIEVDANSFGNVDGLQMKYKTGVLTTGNADQVLQISVDESGATGGEVDLIALETTDTCSSCMKHGIHVGVGFDEALLVSGGSAIDPTLGYTVLTDHTATDRVNGAAGAGDAFLEAGNDVTVFDNDDDYILIGHSATFEVLQVILDTVSSKDCDISFLYSTGDGTWLTLIVDDATAGFTKNGIIDWSAPIDWDLTTHTTPAGTAITSGYYIKLQRTYAQNISVEPIEDYFKIYLDQGGDTGMKITGQGVIKLPYLTGAPSTLENGMMWMESTGLHIYYNSTEKTVAGI